MKKTISLIVAIVMTLTIFTTDIIGITMIVRAQDEYSEEQPAAEEPAAEEPPAEQPAAEEPPAEEPGGQADEGRDEEDSAKAAEEAAQKAAEEEAAKKAAEEEASKKAAEEEAAKKAAEEAEREAAYEKAAKEADEAAKKAEEDEAAKEAKRLADEEEERARKEAEAAKKAEEEKKKAEQEEGYSLTATIGGSPVSTINFGSAQIGQERDIISVCLSNTGSSAVDLIFSKTNDADGAFHVSLRGADSHLEPGQTTQFNVSMDSDLPAGQYSSYIRFADSKRDPNFTRALSLTLTGTVTPRKEVVTNVDVSPSKITLAVGGSAQFTAKVTGNSNNVPAVKWTVAGNRSTGTIISENGILTIAGDESSTALTVIAASTADPSKTGSASVSLQRNSYNVSAYADPAQGGYVTGGGAVSEGGSVTVSAVPNKNFVFDGWVVDGKKVSTATNYSISNIKGNVTAVAKFSQNNVTVTAVANNSDAGSVVGGGTIRYGGSTTLSAKAYDGYVFTGWKEGDSIVSKDASIKLENLTVDRKLTAIFKRTRHTLTLCVYPKDAGTVSGGGEFKLNEGTTIKAVPAPGYRFDGWKVNDEYVSRSAEYRIDKVKEDYTCTAVFIKTSGITYEISAGVATTGGTISPCGKTTVLYGSNITYTITPKSGFAILAVAVDGAMVGPVSSYTFTNVQGPHLIAAAFVQTDAGRKAAEASGKTAQSRKVQPIEKTSKNTAKSDSTIDLDAATAGEGGDKYVEEMDLTGVEIPSDDELGITVDYEDRGDSDVTKMLGKTSEEVNTMVADGDTMPILDAAFLTGHLGAYVVNAFEPSKMISIDYNKLSREELMMASADSINPSFPDLDVVVQKMLTTDDVMKLVKGEQVDIAVSLTGQEEEDGAIGRIMKNAVGKKPVKYFDLTMLKTIDGFTERVTELPTTMEVVIEIPDEVYEAGKTYSVLRVHNGELSVLPDLDDDPKTITFRTDRFSPYAIAKETTTPRSLIAWLAGGAIVALGVAVTCFIILVAHQRRMRKMRRRKNNH